MSGREDAREMLRELLHEALAGTHGNGPGAAPMVPPPPVAAVHRPSTWSAPAGDTEQVTIDSDADLERFVHALLARAERDGEAIRAGRLRFALARAGGTVPAGAPGAASRADAAGPGAASRAHAASAPGAASRPGTILIERGAVTERTVEKAAKAGARLVLGPRAVPTPLAREKARALGIEFERER